ncbi:penicillin-binding protein activator [Celerinatantimonas yamalensis]|uniref:Penicillin-binding protein activator n=1 Tax=Celerinatantimonas yamalensis TaxID=559956 RepID=A0ABW9GAZ5_9GAMM
MKILLSWRLLLCMLTIVVLTGCSSNGVSPQPVSPPTITGVMTLAPSDYLSRAQHAQGSAVFDWQLLAAKAYLQQNKLGAAQQLLQQLHSTVGSKRQQAGWQLVSAAAALLNQHPEQAITLLQFDHQWQLPDDYWRHDYQQLAQLYQTAHQPINAATALIDLEPYLQDKNAALAQNRHQIWQLLKPLNSLTLRSYEQPGNETLNGYLELIAISNEPVSSPQQLLDNLNQWKQSYPNHPAIHFIQGQLSKALQSPVFQPKRIAILLPLSGHFAESGQHIRDGILAAYSDASQQDRGAVQLNFIDTNSQSMMAIIAQIKQLKSDFVIGPLLKSNVSAYAQQNLALPWLALNDFETDNVTPPTQLASNSYSFSLDPGTEAAQAAQQMTNIGEKHPLLLVPDTDIGKRMAMRFSQVWQSNHDDQPDITIYHGRDDLQQAVKRMLLTDQSSQRIQQIRRLLGHDIKAEVRSRRDSNSVYIVADNIDTKLIVPFISVTISPFAPSLQLFGSSRSHQEGVNNNELNGMIVSEMPWLLDHQSDNAKRFAQIWPQASDTDKSLYAMGYDAYQILPHLAQMRGFKDYRLQGLTGVLSVTKDGQIHRQLIWSQYNDGHLESIYQQ